MTRFEKCWGIYTGKGSLLLAQAILEPTFSRINTPTLSNPVIFHTYPPMKMEQSVPKRRHIKIRRRGITQKKAFRTRRKFEIKNATSCFCEYQTTTKGGGQQMNEAQKGATSNRSLKNTALEAKEGVRSVDLNCSGMQFNV